MALRIERLNKAAHDRRAFDCGSDALSAYLKTQALQHIKRGICKAYVLVDPIASARILGFYTLSNSQIARSDLDEREARRLPRHPIPTITLGRMGVQKDQQGGGYGALLVADAMQRCARVSQEVGVYALIVDAKDGGAKAFYRHFGFEVLPEHPMRLILPMRTAIQLLDSH